jgi:hypothetical protein
VMSLRWKRRGRVMSLLEGRVMSLRKGRVMSLLEAG